MKTARWLGLVSVVVGSFAPAGFAAAGPPPRPASFFGVVSVAGGNVAAGTPVAAVVGGSVVAETVTFEAEGASVYRLDVAADDPATAAIEGAVEGDPVSFRVADSAVAETGMWSDGAVVRTDLSARAGADLRVGLTDGLASVSPGASLTYTLSVQNPSAIDAAGVAVTATLPVGSTFLSATDGGAESGGVVAWPGFPLPAGGSVSRALTAQLPETFPAGTTEVESRASVRSDGADGVDPEPADNVAADVDALAAGADVAVEKTADATAAAPGDDIVYTLTARNLGAVGASGVALSDTLPGDVTFLSASDDGREVAGVVTWPAFDLPAGASALRTLRVRFDGRQGESELVNRAAVVVPGGDLDPGNDGATHTLPVVTEADLTVGGVDVAAAAVDPQSLAASGSVSVSVENAGNGAAGPFRVAVFSDLDRDGT